MILSGLDSSTTLADNVSIPIAAGVLTLPADYATVYSQVYVMTEHSDNPSQSWATDYLLSLTSETLDKGTRTN